MEKGIEKDMIVSELIRMAMALISLQVTDLSDDQEKALRLADKALDNLVKIVTD